ncbi:GTPase IMAP family member GIMD1 [Hyla sarda]|uniref:GTPase IMAP family member GIMD1 n=1 Tax=Hyla sarda TaxID=327740 RepID=UPI0024C267E8|nr:GTPase IMAP family member GIMD1 [Hyla sarda]XP_056422002.1 GTPase IMAP family member GIMD1 [Hyla sarda]
MDDNNEITINLLLLGKTQCGKSSLGNSLLGSYEFESRIFPQSVTKECRLRRMRIPEFARRSGKELGLRLQVLDTPGIPHSSLNQDEVKKGVRKALSEHFPEGLHMALLGLRADIPHCEEDNQHTVKLTEDLLGPNWMYFTAVVLTHAETLEDMRMTEEKFISLAPKSLSTLLERVHGRCIFSEQTHGTSQAERKVLVNQILHFVRQNSYQSLQPI